MDSEKRYLVSLDEDEKIYPLGDGITRIGRAVSNEVQLKNSSVSKIHCVLARSGNEVQVFDFSSKNGTWIGNDKANGQILTDGEEIRVGDMRLVFHTQENLPPKSNLPTNHKIPKIMTEEWESALFAEKTTKSKFTIGHSQATSWLLFLIIGFITGSLLTAILKKNAETPAEISGNIDQREQVLLRELKQQKQKYANLVTKNNERVKTLQEQIKQIGVELQWAEREKELQRALLAQAKAQVQRLREELDQLLAKEEKIVDESKSNSGSSKPLPEENNSQEKNSSSQNPPPKNRHILSDKQLAILTDKAISIIKEYTNPLAKAGDLQPIVARFSSMGNQAAATKIMELYDYTQKLLITLQGDIAAEQKRHRNLERLLKRQQMKPREIGAYQRAVELLAKQIQIHQKQQKLLLQFRSEILQGIPAMTSLNATLFLAKKFNKYREAPLRKAILKAIVAGNARHAVPILIRHLHTTDPELKQAILQALRKITEANYGDDPAKWKKWWTKNKAIPK